MTGKRFKKIHSRFAFEKTIRIDSKVIKWDEEIIGCILHLSLLTSVESLQIVFAQIDLVQTLTILLRFDHFLYTLFLQETIVWETYEGQSEKIRQEKKRLFRSSLEFRETNLSFLGIF